MLVPGQDSDGFSSDCLQAHAILMAGLFVQVAHLSRRTELFTVFRNIVKLMPEQAYSFVEAQLQGIVGQSSAAYQVGPIMSCQTQ